MTYNIPLFMRKLVLIVSILILLVLSGCTNVSDNSETSADSAQVNEDVQSGATQTIEIKNMAFSPIQLKVGKGDTIIWINEDSAKHTVTSDSGIELDSELLSKSMTYSHTFKNTGTYGYHCGIHPSMIGSIIVE